MPSRARRGQSDHLITLDDGRTLGYLEIGDPDGAPLISCHGGLSCRLDVVPAAEAARAHGVRLIAPDRPGIGLSDRREGRTLLDWPDDVAELADQLGLDQFALMGWSFGGGFAQACGFKLADRISELGLIASVIPLQWEGMKAEIDRMDRILMDLSGKASPVERTVFHLMHATAKHLPRAFGRETGAPSSVALELSAAIAEGLEHGHGVVDEYRIFDQPWGFEPSDISVPTHIWQGSADDLCPPRWGERLHEAIGSSTFTMVPDASHFLWYDHWDDIFTALR